MPKPDASSQSGTIGLRIGGEPVRVTVTVPNAAVHPVQILPAAATLTDAIVSAMQERATREGNSISCRAGCAACCRQIVPLSTWEARHIANHIAAIPEPKRTSVVSRFQAAVQAMSDASLTEPFLNPDARAGRSIHELGLAYLALGIPCPLLENEACSIYAIRPMACREHLVTSPAEHCANPASGRAHSLPMPARVSAALIQISGQPYVPLPLALDWASSTPDTLSTRSAQDILRNLLANLTGKPVGKTDSQPIP
ncbi:MAG: YkgJ family cysteine cluster protein [Bryobacterales bacterium]|nr:YkgJ family cysteine cluster protein [Bryobacterales bacterium]